MKIMSIAEIKEYHDSIQGVTPWDEIECEDKIDFVQEIHMNVILGLLNLVNDNGGE